MIRDDDRLLFASSTSLTTTTTTTSAIKIPIEDTRELADFKGITFSGYKLTDVLKQLLQSLEKSQIETSCYWVAELVCSGHFVEIWETFAYFYSKFIHGADGALAVYLGRKLAEFKIQLKMDGFQVPPLEYRNKADIRVLYSTVAYRLASCRRISTIEEVKFTKSEFEFAYMMTMLSPIPFRFSSSLSDSNLSLFGGLELPLKELFWQIEERNIVRARYWLFWIMEYAISNKSVERLGEDLIWTIWKFVVNKSRVKAEEEEEEDQMEKKMVTSLLALFKFNLQKSGKSKWTKMSHVQWNRRKFLLLFAIHLVADVHLLNARSESNNPDEFQQHSHMHKMMEGIYFQIRKQNRNKN